MLAGGGSPQPGYGSVDSAQKRTEISTKFRATAIAVLLSLCVIIIVLSIASTQLGDDGAKKLVTKLKQRTTKLADPGYMKWLSTLTGPADYQTDSDYDGKFESQNTQHMDISHLVPSALPSSKSVADMQGADFAADLTASTATGPVDMDEINKLPEKLKKIRKQIDAEKVLVQDLQAIVDAHALPNPESIVVHVGQRGPQGAKGMVGARGQVGDQGQKGDTGDVGQPGDPGARGPQGDQGPKGATGAPGPAGNVGYPGLPGMRGEVGVEGLEGLAGDPGAPGEVGPPGAQGPNGANGLQGDTGPIGAEGLPGTDQRIICLAIVNGKCYSQPIGGDNWFGAEQTCVNWGGHLFSFETADEYAVAQNVFPGRTFWLGMRYISGMWKFSDGTSSTYAQTLWASGEPNFNGGIQPLCSSSAGWTPRNQNIDDVGCYQIAAPYLCVKKLPVDAKMVE